MLYRLALIGIICALGTGCQHQAYPDANAALDAFCRHKTITGEGDVTDDDYRTCKAHFVIDSEGAANWYITGNRATWPRSGDLLVGMPTIQIDKATGKQTVASIAN